MLLLDPILHVALLCVATGTSTLLAGYAYRTRDRPGTREFAALMATIGVWTATYGVSMLVTSPEWRIVMERVQWFGAVYTPVALLVFALSYTGHDDVVSRRSIAALAAVPTFSIALVWTNPGGIMYTDYAVSVENGLSLIDMAWAAGFWVYVVYGYALVAVAAALLLRLVYLSDSLYLDQSVLLLVGIAAPFVGNVYDLFGPPALTLVETAPYAFTVTGLAFGYALFRRRLFDLVPATRQLGRDDAISQLEDAVVIVDTDRRIVYANAAAESVIDSTPAAAIGTELREFVDQTAIDLGAEDALAELERDDRVYEVRSSPVTDREDRPIGHTLLFTDVTARKHREQRLAAQRDDLARLERLNGVLRSINQALVSASSRSEIERAVCDHLADSTLYRTSCMADVATWTGDADRWSVGTDGGGRGDVPSLDGELEADVDWIEGAVVRTPSSRDTDRDRDEEGDKGGTWTIVPVTYGHTVFGAIGLHTDRDAVGERERAVLAELGETVGHAINAAEHRQLLAAEVVVELEVECTDERSPLVEATAAGERVTLAGVVPNADGETVTYLEVQSGDPDAVCERLTAATDGRVRRIDEGVLEWQVTGTSVLTALTGYGANVTDVTAEDGRALFAVELASTADVRALSDHLEDRFSDTRVVSRRERADPTDDGGPPEAGDLDDLTERQREVLEAAYRAGYFDWPRDSTAEEVADSLDIDSSTLHAHLRKAEHSLLDDLFDSERRRRD